MGATDASTQQLMDIFYDSLNQGTTPDVALRNALSPCSIPTDHFATPIARLPANSMRDYSSILLTAHRWSFQIASQVAFAQFSGQVGPPFPHGTLNGSM